MARARFVKVALGAAAVVALVAPAAHAQSVDDAVDTLATKDVAYEQDAIDNGVLDEGTILEIEAATATVQDPEAFFKTVVLGSPVSDFTSPRAFADEVLRRLGGDGRVLVFDTNTVGVSSTVDSLDEVTDAEQAALSAGSSYTASITAAADALGEPAVGGGGSGGGGDGGESTSGAGGLPVWLLLVLLVVGMGVVMLFVLSHSRKSKRDKMPGPLDAEAAQRVRAEVDAASNLVIALADRVELSDVPAEAKSAFSEGAIAYADIQDDLEEADTRPELEDVWPRLVRARWRLECARSLLDGAPPPQEPTPAPLFPAYVMPVPKAAPDAPRVPLAPSAGYKHMDASPWLTQAATIAATILLSRGMGGGHGRGRPPMDDIGGLWTGGRSGGSSRSARGRPPVFGRGTSGSMGRRRR